MKGGRFLCAEERETLSFGHCPHTHKGLVSSGSKMYRWNSSQLTCKKVLLWCRFPYGNSFFVLKFVLTRQLQLGHGGKEKKNRGL